MLAQRDLPGLLDKVAKLPPDWHAAVAVSGNVLTAIAYHAIGNFGVR